MVDSRGFKSVIRMILQMKVLQVVIWIIVSVIGAFAWSLLAVARNEQINTIWFLAAGLSTYAIGYRFYSKYIVKKILKVNDNVITPAHELDDGKVFTPTPKPTLFGHHFASIAGAGPLVGPVLASQMGFLPGTMWIIFGVILAGGVQDMIVLFFSMKSKGRSLGQMAEEVLGKVGGRLVTFLVSILVMIVLAVLALICVNAMAESSWAVFSISCTLPIALLMGLYLKYLRPGKVMEVSIIGFVLLIIAVFGGQIVAESSFGELFHLTPVQLVFYVAIYCFLVAVLPVWLLLVPKDYLSTFMKVGTILVLAIAIIVVHPLTQVPALTNFAFNTEGPAFAGNLFPFLFITIACGALSGFHATIASGTTPKMVDKQSDVRAIGYGGMLMESFVALMALVAAISLNQGVYFSINMPPATIAKIAATQYDKTASVEENANIAVQKLAANPDGNPLQIRWSDKEGSDALKEVASDVGEHSIVSRTGGAPTLAVSMANILHSLPIVGGKNMLGFWYHFAVMFEALFILSALTGGTIALRAQFSEIIGRSRRNRWMQKFSDTAWTPGVIISSLLVILIWACLLMMGVTDPNGGIKIMYPLFGVANQLIAVISLTICSLALLKHRLHKFVWVTVLPLVWVSIVTITASFQKIFSSDANIGYFKMFFDAKSKIANGGESELIEAATLTARNSLIQGSLSVVFLILVIIILVIAAKRCFVHLHSK